MAAAVQSAAGQEAAGEDAVLRTRRDVTVRAVRYCCCSAATEG